MLLLLGSHPVSSGLVQLCPCPLALPFLPLALVLSISHISSLHIYSSWSLLFLSSFSVFVRSHLALMWKNLTGNPVPFNPQFVMSPGHMSCLTKPVFFSPLGQPSISL